MEKVTTSAEERRAAVRAEWIAAVRRITDWLEEHPEVPRPYHVLGEQMWIYVRGSDARATMATIARAFGKADKTFDDDRFEISRSFGAITLIASAHREDVCERVVIGTREVNEEKADPKAVAALPKVSVTTTVEDVKWVCHPLLAEVQS